MVFDAAGISRAEWDMSLEEMTANGMKRHRPMSEPPPNRPGIVPLVGQRVAAGVAEHVWVRF